MSFTARHPGECGGCGFDFEEGDELRYNSLKEIIALDCCGSMFSDPFDPLDFDPDDSSDIKGE